MALPSPSLLSSRWFQGMLKRTLADTTVITEADIFRRGMSAMRATIAQIEMSPTFQLPASAAMQQQLDEAVCLGVGRTWLTYSESTGLKLENYGSLETGRGREQPPGRTPAP